MEILFEDAIEADCDDIADLMLDAGGVTTRVTLGILGVATADDARPLMRLAHQRTRSWRHTTLARVDGVLVGALSTRGVPYVPPRRLLRFYPLRLRWLWGLRGRLRAAGRVTALADSDHYSVGELFVTPSHQGRGVGTLLLERAEHRARERGRKGLTLQVWVGNRAISLYERFGFEVVETLLDDEFERLTGSVGSHKMVKSLRLRERRDQP